MEGQASLGIRRENQASLWEERYSKRHVLVHRAEDLRLPCDLRSKDAVISKFLDLKGTELDPPNSIRFFQLHKFLSKANEAMLDELSLPDNSEEVFLLDDRRDPNFRANAKRAWDSFGEAEEGYMDYPPIGEDIFSKKLNIRELYSKLSRKVTVPKCYAIS